MKTPRQTVEWTDRLLIGGEAISGNGPIRKVYDPATEEVLFAVADPDAAQCDLAIEAAKAAFQSGTWADKELRSKLLAALADEMEARRADLTASVVYEVGTPIATAEVLQVSNAIRVLRRYASLAGSDLTATLPAEDGAVRGHSTVSYRPAGVVAAITAYNYPMFLAATKIGAALAAGCTVVLLASPQAPLSTLLIGEIATKVGFPPGVLNVIVGGPEVGRRVTENPAVAVVSFTGSVAVGKAVMQQASHHVANVVLELGGKSPAIVLPGADLKAIVKPLHQRYARNAGQGCASPTRLLIPAQDFDEFLDLSSLAYEEITVGDPWDRATIVGPLISDAHRARVEGYIQSALDDGGFIAAGGGRPDIERGWFVNPALIAGLPSTSRVCREEIFGPVAVALSYSDLDEAVSISNDSDLGLHAMIFGDHDIAVDLAPRLAVGQVSINGGGSGFRSDAPMGGFKQSGIGRESGTWGLMEFLEPQHVHWPL